MKKILFVFVLIFLFLSIVPAKKFDKEWWGHKFNSNPEKTWKLFEDNPDFWSDDVARNAAFEFDSTIASKLINEEISKQYVSLGSISLNQESFWIQDSKIVDFLDEKIQEDPEILNGNIYLKKEWFAQNKILDEGAEIDSFDGKKIKTKGPNSTVFDINDEIFSEARILPSGKVILKNGPEITSSVVSRDSDGGLIFKGGDIDISSLSEIQFKMLGGGIKVGKSTYSSSIGEPLSVKIEGESVLIKGNEVIERDNFGEILSKFTGALRTNGHKTLGDSTIYTLFSNGKESRTYNVDKATDFYSKEGGCEESTISCIEETRFSRSKSYRIWTNLQEMSGSEDFNLDKFLETKLKKTSPKDPNYRIWTNLQEMSGSEDFNLEDHIGKELEKISNYKDIKINSKNNNFIKIDHLDGSINKMDIDQIEDNSSVIFNDQEKVSWKFTKNPVKIQGDPTELETSVTTIFPNKYGVSQEFRFMDSTIYFGPDSFFIGESSSTAKEVRDNVRKVSKEEKKQLKKQLKEKWGVRARDYLFTIDDSREDDFINAVISATESASNNKYGVELTEEEVFTTFLMEGGYDLFKEKLSSLPIPEDETKFEYKGKKYLVKEDSYGDKYIIVDGEYYKTNSDELFISGLGTIGTDVIGKPGEFKRLKKGGFIPKDIEMERGQEGDIDGEIVISGDFTGLENGLKVQAGVLADRKRKFISDYKHLFGIDPRETLTQEEMFYWTTVYYNSKDPKGKLKSQNGKIKKGNPSCPDYCYDPYTNAARRVAAMELIKGKFSPEILKLLLASK